MDGNLYLILDKQVNALKETLESLIEHRESITSNDDLYANDVETMIEPVDAQILAAIDGIADLTKHLKPESNKDTE
jgi:uncharacterized protein YbaP (TraB family)